MNTSDILRGHCGVTEVGGDCVAGQHGAWEGVLTLQACIARCSRCPRCNYVSYSRKYDDCSWYHECATRTTDIPGEPKGAGDTHRTVRVAASSRNHRKPSVLMRPPWPAAPYQLACPAATPQDVCSRLSDPSLGAKADFCFDPEGETEEVLSSLLLRCGQRPCVYVDIGCNLGYFAAHAAALGAWVDCYEPTPFYVEAIRRTIALNRFQNRFNVTQAAVVVNVPAPAGQGAGRAAGKGALFERHSRNFLHMPCGIGREDADLARSWKSQHHEIGPTLRGRTVDLLKIDIDSIEGELLHEVVRLIEAGEVHVRSMLIELGSGATRFEACKVAANKEKPLCTEPATERDPTPRGGDVRDLHRLVHELGYSVWRVNIHVNREIFGGHGANLNAGMSPQHESWEPFFSVRAMRKIERLRRSTPLSEYDNLLRWGQSLLITRETLMDERRTEHNNHHTLDVQYATLELPLQ